MFQFPNMYRAWRADAATSLRHDSITDGSDRDHLIVTRSSSDSPEQAFFRGDHTERAVAEILMPVASETNKTILRLHAEGFGIDEIAELLDLGYKAVESRLYRAREAIRERREA